VTKVEAEARSLDDRMTGWLVASGLAHRALLMPASLAASDGVLGRATPAFTVVAVVAVIANAALAVSVCRGRRPAVLESRLFFVGDLCFAAALNILATIALPSGTFLSTGRDVFWQYALGTVVVWTSQRGVRVGTAVWAGGVLLEGCMIEINNVALTATGVIQALGQIGWLLAALIVPAVIMAFATKGTQFALRESLKAGRLAERTRALTDLHDTALQAFAQIASRSVDTTRSTGSRISDIRRIAADEIRRGTTAISEVGQAPQQSLGDGLQALIREFRSRGLTVNVQIRSQSLGWVLRAEVVIALLAATREALNNVHKHAGVDRAEVTLAASSQGTLVTEVLDAGCGFDMATASTRFGLQNSIRRRIQDVGGLVVIYSARGFGTRIRMSVPAHPKEGTVPKRSLITHASMRRSTSLEEQALGWFVIPALTYRACLTPLQAALAIASLPRHPSGLLLAAMSCLFLMDITLLITARSAIVMRLFALPQFMVADFVIAAMLNIWVAIDLAEGTALMPGRQFLWGYMFGTVILWTALRGVRAGALLTTLSVALEGLLVILNHDSISLGSAAQAAAQVGKLVAAFLITLLIAQLARRGVRLAAKAGDEAGRQLERAAELLQLYKGAMEGLTRIVEICDAETPALTRRLRQIRGVALQQISTLRSVLPGREHDYPAALRSELDIIVDSFREAGLRVEFVSTELERGWNIPYAKSIARAAHAALQNVVDHAGVVHVVVWAADVDDATEIIIRDQGIGFPIDLSGAQVATKISEAGRIGDFGGSVDVWSAPECGTRVIIRVPHSSSVPDILNDPAHAHEDSEDRDRRHDDKNNESLSALGTLAAYAKRTRNFPQGLEEITHDFPVHLEAES